MGFLQTHIGLIGFHDFQLLFRYDDQVFFNEWILDISCKNMNIYLFLRSDKSQFPSSSIILHKDDSPDDTFALCNEFIFREELLLRIVKLLFPR